MKGRDFPWLGHGHLSSCWLNHPRYSHEGATCVLCQGLNQKVTPIHSLCFLPPLQAALAAEATGFPGRATAVGVPRPSSTKSSAAGSGSAGWPWSPMGCPTGWAELRGPPAEQRDITLADPEEPVGCSYSLIRVGQIPQSPDMPGVTPQQVQAGS